MTMTKKLLLCFALAAGTLAAQSSYTTLVVPNANTLVPGNSPEAIPTTSTTVEVQVLLGSGQFFSSPITISGLSLRAAPGTGPVNEAISSISITLSTSPNFPNTNGGTLMSTTFAKNVGKDATLVFSGKNLTAKSVGCAGPGACPFDLNVPFTTPFTYSRTSGALLIDITETVNGTGTLDGVSYNAPGGPVATVVGAVGSATGTFSYGGSIFQLTYTTSAPMLTGVVNTASNIPPGPRELRDRAGQPVRDLRQQHGSIQPGRREPSASDKRIIGHLDHDCRNRRHGLRAGVFHSLGCCRRRDAVQYASRQRNNDHYLQRTERLCPDHGDAVELRDF